MATAKFLIKNGAKLTITDLNSPKELKSTLAKLRGLKADFVLGEHREEDFKNNDIIVFNPAVGIFNKWVKVAQKYKKPIENDLSLFLKLLGDEKYAAITGTRGKTTSTTWAHHFLKPAIVGGNIPNAGLFKIIEQGLRSWRTTSLKSLLLLRRIVKYGSVRCSVSPRISSNCVIPVEKISNLKKEIPLILELSSFQLEFFKKGLTAPKVAAITNLYSDHLNRYGTMDVYAKMKSNIFLNQTKKDFLILNYDDKNKSFFLKEKPKSRIFYISAKKLPANENGLYFTGNKIYFQLNGEKEFVVEVADFTGHQKYNLLTALLTAYLYNYGGENMSLGGGKWHIFTKKISTLPTIPFRQQVIFNKNGLMIINDSAATSPDGAIAAIERFKNSKNFFLISGGTDKNLDFKKMAKRIKEILPSKNLFLLDGSATKKLIGELNKINYFKSKPIVFDNLKEIVDAVKKRVKTGVVVFSPAAASFEKFKNEFDRGGKFNKLVKESFK